ncbi:MAG: tRNA1Val (adenine37-N6)-methyltransferase [Flavobacteriales bacterium]|jgi:tRNA1Val (adenine37-N6)-methyltransferase
MKVGTDSIMLGSWVQTKSAQHILDVGSGSGLLAIMLAQKAQHNCLIDGIDIDVGAIAQAKSNAKNCPWALQLTFKNSSLQQFPTTIAYDLIVSNPPYFSINLSANQTHSTKSRINARQTVALDHPTLLKEVTKHLSSNGKFCCVLPFDTAKVFIVDAESVGLYCIQDLHVKPNPQSNITRLLLEFSRTKETKISTKLSIYNHLGSYSDEYIALCKDYYLNF